MNGLTSTSDIYSACTSSNGRIDPVQAAVNKKDIHRLSSSHVLSQAYISDIIPRTETNFS
jgi:hypothetical protein